MILSDKEILHYCEQGMITPFERQQIRTINSFGQFVPCISYGVSSYGYDIRLSPDDFRLFRHVPGKVVDPKDFRPGFLEKAKLVYAHRGDYFIIPANSYALGVSMERFDMPPDVTAIALGKSTYARCGLIVNITPLEAKWQGYLTIEISNASTADVRVYAGEGIAQLLFFKGNPCETSYADRAGKYQGQAAEVVLPRV